MDGENDDGQIDSSIMHNFEEDEEVLMNLEGCVNEGQMLPNFG